MNYQMKTIIWPTDFSEPSMEALNAAFEFASRFDADLLAVHVIELSPETSEWREASKFSVPLPLEEQRKKTQKDLEKILSERQPSGLRTRVAALIGDVPESIVRIARQEKTAMIVIATHGRSGVRRLVFGSVAEKVVRHAACPVLSVRVSGKE